MKRLKKAVKEIKSICNSKSSVINAKTRFDLMLIANDIESYINQCQTTQYDAIYVSRLNTGKKI